MELIVINAYQRVETHPEILHTSLKADLHRFTFVISSTALNMSKAISKHPFWWRISEGSAF